MDERYEKFRTSRQAAVKLDIALSEGFRPGAPEAYGQYLRLRGGPAAEALIRQEDTQKLAIMAQNGWFPGDRIRELLALAVETGSHEALLWLLEWKKANGGFGLRDLSL